MSDYTLCADAGRSIASLNLRRFQKLRLEFGGRAVIGILCAASGGLGCGGQASIDPNATINVKARGALVAVDGGDTIVGFARGTIRATERTTTFQISKSPITKGEYEACQKAGVCKAPALDECSDPVLARDAMSGTDDNVAICVGRDNAQTYCRWVGGRLPTLPEWLRAARGPTVQEYPWGGKRATCAQHPKSVEWKLRIPRSSAETISTEGCSHSAAEILTVNRHPAGAAARSGMQDVLIAPAELLAGYSTSPFAVCGQGQQCLVYGVNPGAIDSVAPYAVSRASAAQPGEEPRPHVFPIAYGFRCLIEK